ncbi:hypothetical protein [Cytobacillus oceanisediminis]|uniref:hypothetical protein n=1 Tax=Cytobacillus oceanisediminis TaxID=665099 RepID=UPI00207A214E|nr:hypothetical protein [Cytobacillus oceanisediminis]USK42039.1 hypothetical protein LIT27_15350 [Cytobacillus oceanisediminis]
MKNKFFLILFIALFVSYSSAYAQSLTYPCSIVLEPVNEVPNISGTALIAKVKKPYTDQPGSPVRERTAVGIYADWMPQPSAFGDYDQYEGFAQIPGVISWRFKMYPIKEDQPSWFGGSPWVRKFDEISAELSAETIVSLRLSNSRTNRLGPAVLQSTLKGCVQ